MPGSLDPAETGTWTLYLQLLYLIILLHNAGTSAISDHMQKGLRPGENAEPNTTGSEKKSNRKATAYATAKLLLY